MLGIILLSENISSNYDYNKIEYSNAKEEGRAYIENNNSKDIMVIVEYEMKLKNTNEQTIIKGNEKYYIKSGKSLIINIYDICNIDKNKVSLLSLNVREYNFFLNIPSYIYIIFIFITIIICVYCYICIKMQKREEFKNFLFLSLKFLCYKKITPGR